MHVFAGIPTSPLSGMSSLYAFWMCMIDQLNPSTPDCPELHIVLLVQQSVGKDLQSHSLSGSNKFQGISNDVRKEYADKLEQVYLEVHAKFNVKDSCGSDFP